ncbi:MAG: hypothetical protein Ctma_0443 [Catillopecten margaritatus gill symbiont]|uniref:KilA-N DNA-binding domain-containing protein n=1 Tax=Catillopecten margaritatus gill symbiont TaxID=3083288 RepID=A0AAU6PFH5_9GAMM
MSEGLTIDNIQDLIIVIREIPVIIDSDVAKLYGVQTKEVNQAVKNNPDKFPQGFILELDKNELENLRSKNLTTNALESKSKNLRSQNATANLSKTRVTPKAFTEQGLYMLATILKSKQATKTTLQIITTFAKIRNLKQDFNQVLNETNEETKNTIGAKFGAGLMEIFLDEGLESQSSETKINFQCLA